MHLIEEAYELLRKTKNGVSTPQAEGKSLYEWLQKFDTYIIIRSYII